MPGSPVPPPQQLSPPTRIEAAAGQGRRLVSLDVLRGCDVLLMLFVNEIAGVRGTPAFLLHKPRDADGMTVTDLVFPAFLFILGMAIPFAVGGRLRRGQSRGEVWRHVLSRALALIVMGVLMVNAEEAGARGVPTADAWNVLMTVAVLLAFRAPAPGEGPRRTLGLRAAGWVLLLGLAVAYRSGDPVGWIQLRPHWWGILGLIGWAYLVAAGLYLLAGDRPAILVGLVGLLYCLYLADEAGQWLRALQPVMRVGRVLGSHAAVALSGTVLGAMATGLGAAAPLPGSLVRRALGFAAALATAGLLLHTLHGLDPAFWINKVLATAPWCLVSSALTCVAWAAISTAVEILGWRRWPRAVHLAGENALVAYLVAPLLLSLFALSAPLFGGVNPYDALGSDVWSGFLRSGIFAWLVVRLCAGMRSYGVTVQL